MSTPSKSSTLTSSSSASSSQIISITTKAAGNPNLSSGFSTTIGATTSTTTSTTAQPSFTGAGDPSAGTGQIPYTARVVNGMSSNMLTIIVSLSVIVGFILILGLACCIRQRRYRREQARLAAMGTASSSSWEFSADSQSQLVVARASISKPVGPRHIITILPQRQKPLPIVPPSPRISTSSSRLTIGVAGHQQQTGPEHHLNNNPPPSPSPSFTSTVYSFNPKTHASSPITTTVSSFNPGTMSSVRSTRSSFSSLYSVNNRNTMMIAQLQPTANSRQAKQNNRDSRETIVLNNRPTSISLGDAWEDEELQY